MFDYAVSITANKARTPQATSGLCHAHIVDTAPLAAEPPGVTDGELGALELPVRELLGPVRIAGCDSVNGGGEGAGDCVEDEEPELPEDDPESDGDAPVALGELEEWELEGLELEGVWDGVEGDDEVGRPVRVDRGLRSILNWSLVLPESPNTAIPSDQSGV